MPVTQLTPSFINNLTVQPGKARTEWCDKNQPGLYVEARETSPGKGTYYLRYKDTDSKTRHMRLGDTSTLSLSEARARAKEEKAKLQLGATPFSDAKAKKDVPTLQTFVTEIYIPFIKQRNRSYRDCVNRLNFRILPKFGSKKLTDISRQEIIKHMQDIREEGLTAASVNHVAKLMRRILNVAIDLGVIAGPNVAAKIPMYVEDNFVENILTEEQLASLIKTIETHPNRTPCLVLKWLLATGARLGESLRCSYDQINFDNNTWLVPAAHSKSKKRHVVPLNESALEVLSELAHENRKGFLFRNQRTGDRLKTLHRAFKKIKKAAGLEDVQFRVHDTRHFHAALVLRNGGTLVQVKEILGHSSYAVTERYLHMAESSLHSASSTVHQALKNASASPKPTPPELKLITTGS